MDDNLIHRLSVLQQELASLEPPAYPDDLWPLIKSWIAKALPIIRRDWPDFFDDFQKITIEPKGSGIMFMNTDFTISQHESQRLWRIENERAQEAKRHILNFLDGLLALAPSSSIDSKDKALFLCAHFPIFIQQLKVRERGRSPIEVNDEYDVQYLFLALLRLHFDDVRKEVWTPNYAGGSSRMDFLLKREKIVIETKKTRDTLKRDCDVGDQLIIDIERYAQYPDCKILICFVYDPDLLLDNPRGLEQDLSGMRENMEVVVVVS